ncbi:MAG: hypothetical protein PVJ84_22525 [Desulfobacteraceae bacterium]|jgi:hypothetical protein
MSDYSTSTDAYPASDVGNSTLDTGLDSEYAEQVEVAEEAIAEAATPIAMAISNVQSSACKKFTENAKKVAKQACDELKEE